MSATSSGIYDNLEGFSLVPPSGSGFGHSDAEGGQSSANTVSQVMPVPSTQFHLAAGLDSTSTSLRPSGIAVPFGDSRSRQILPPEGPPSRYAFYPLDGATTEGPHVIDTIILRRRESCRPQPSSDTCIRCWSKRKPVGVFVSTSSQLWLTPS